MAVAADSHTSPAVALFAIGATIFAGALVTGPLTGGSFNPARSLSPSIVGGIWVVLWLYWTGPVLGAVLGIRVYEVLRTASAPSVSVGRTGAEGPIE